MLNLGKYIVTGAKMDIKNFVFDNTEQPLQNLNDDCGFAAIFRNIGVIGDSLSSGEFESTDGNGTVHYHDMYEYSWPSFLGRTIGAEIRNFSRGGMTAKEYYSGYADERGFWQPCQAYIIGLGNNDLFVFNMKAGCAADIHIGDGDKNPDTFFGWLGKIIDKLKTLQKDARIFLVSMTRDGSSVEHDKLIEYVADEMAKVAQMYEYCYLIDMTKHAPVYDAKVRDAFAMGYHPNCMGYYIYAKMIGNYMDYLIRKNYKDFFEVPFIGTGLKNNTVKR